MVLIITATFMLIVITTTICSGMLSTADGKARARGKAQFLTEGLGVFATERGSEGFACVCVRVGAAFGVAFVLQSFATGAIDQRRTG